MAECTCCKQETEKVAKLNFVTLEGAEFKIQICGECAKRIEEKQSGLIVCRNCRTVLWLENREEDQPAIQVQEECHRCADLPEAAQIFPMV